MTPAFFGIQIFNDRKNRVANCLEALWHSPALERPFFWERNCRGSNGGRPSPGSSHGVAKKTGPVLVVFWGFVGDDISYPGCSGDLCENFCKRMRAQVYLYIIYLYHDTVDGMNPSNSPVEGTVVEIPLFTTGFIHVRWCRISEPSTVCHVFWPNGIILHQPRFPWNKGMSLLKPPFGVKNSCEVATIWPEMCGYPPEK